MANLKFFLGLIPATSKLETVEATLQSEYEIIEQVKVSERLKRYNELDKIVHSTEFISRVKAIRNASFKHTREYARLKQLNQLKKNKQLKTFFAFSKKGYESWLIEFENSALLNEFNELTRLVNSPDFFKLKKTSSTEFESSGYKQKEKRLKELKKLHEIKQYFKLKKSGDYATFKKVKASEMPQKFEELTRFVHSEEFEKVRQYHHWSAEERFKTSDEYALQTEYETLKNSDDIQLYLKNKDSKKYDWFRIWEPAFSDDFHDTALDTQKWLTRYYYGDKLLNAPYSLASDLHFVTDGANIKVNGGELSIITREEKISGQSWNPMIGFAPKEFKYTSGLINTGHSFRQQYGLFRAKVRLNDTHPVTHAFWLASERIVPQIDIFKYQHKKLTLNNFWGNVTDKSGIKNQPGRLSASRLLNDFFIYEVEWAPEKIIWRINGLVVKEQTQGVPKEPMYLVLSSGLYSEPDFGLLPANMDVDWVRVYKKK